MHSLILTNFALANSSSTICTLYIHVYVYVVCIQGHALPVHIYS